MSFGPPRRVYDPSGRGRCAHSVRLPSMNALFSRIEQSIIIFRAAAGKRLLMAFRLRVIGYKLFARIVTAAAIIMFFTFISVS